MGEDVSGERRKPPFGDQRIYCCSHSNLPEIICPPWTDCFLASVAVNCKQKWTEAFKRW